MFLEKIITKVQAASIDLGEGVSGPSNFQKGLSTDTNKLGDFMSTIITSITVVASLGFVIFFTLAGLKWITAGGDKSKTQEAKDQMVHAVMGVVVVIVSYFIIGIVGGVLGIDILNPFGTILKGASSSSVVTGSSW